MMLNPYYHNPFMMNPLLMMMMQINMMPMNPYEGNGLLHPVYISPMMMHQLEQSVPAWKDPALDNAKEGNMDCIHGATVSCADSGQKAKTVDTMGQIQIKEMQTPEKISCFAGCADENPCDSNLYSSFVASEHSCDGNQYFYYTCESFEELSVFANACARHAAGAKVDVPITTLRTRSKYKKWRQKVMHNREEGKGREIMFNDDSIEPGMGMSIGAGKAGNLPITDEELGNVRDKKYHQDRHLAKQEDYSDDIGLVYEEYDSNEEVQSSANVFANRHMHHHETLETMIMSVWGVLFSLLLICFCCSMAVCCGFMIKEIRRKMKKKRTQIRRYIDINESDDDIGVLEVEG
eukprot:232975_1